jgi:hypothetical protein
MIYINAPGSHKGKNQCSSGLAGKLRERGKQQVPVSHEGWECEMSARIKRLIFRKSQNVKLNRLGSGGNHPTEQGTISGILI